MPVWQGPERNEWIGELGAALAAGRDLPPPAAGAPGPFSLADPGRVEALLASAGLPDVPVGRTPPAVCAWARTPAAHPTGGDVLVVAHGGVISVYVCQLLGVSLNSLWRVRVDNASLTVVRPPRLVTVNDTTHLEEGRGP